ncbi:hypothetical protein [Pseudomonas koreensis]|uniref:hypothetical protein n=1 Tax=Pseudomonas koreensis TaxID=198620 RepID=UPI0014125987|nr:hypothetical protein [Pseudomonas koreensis]NHX01550.1 hypothetical protein [Pseudomonas koreensis]
MRAIWNGVKKIFAFLKKIPGKIFELLLAATGIPWLSDWSSKWLARKRKFLLAALCANLLYLGIMGLSIWGITAHWDDWERLQFISAFLSLAYLLLQYFDAVHKSYKDLLAPESAKDSPVDEAANFP